MRFIGRLIVSRIAVPVFLAALLVAPPVKASEGPVLLDWLWLIPEAIIEEMLSAANAEAGTWAEDDESGTSDASGGIDHQTVGVQDTSDWSRSYVDTFNGQLVKIPGFMLPLDFDVGKVNEFLLVPYYGACIHTPPPPPNQIIMVKSDAPIAVAGMFDPIYVTGTMSVKSTQTDLAEAGYHIAAVKIEPYTQ